MDIPPKPSMRIITDMLTYCSKSMPYYNTISISGYHIREAGSTAAQELHSLLLMDFPILSMGLILDSKVDDFAPRLSFFFNSHLDFLKKLQSLEQHVVFGQNG